MAKKISKLTFYFLLFCIILDTNVSSMGLNPFFYDNNGRINQIDTYSSIEGGNLRSDMVLEGYVFNQTLAKNPKAFFQLTLFVQEPERISELNLNKKIIVCDNKTLPGGSFIEHKLDCNKTVNYELDLDNNPYPTLKFNLSELTGKDFVIEIDYTMKNMVIEEGDYYVGWIETNCNSPDVCPPEGFIIRTLMLPANSTIQSWNNFKIIRRDNGRWILESKGNVDSMVWYRDPVKEKRFAISWEYSVLLLAIGFTIMFNLIQLFLHKDNWKNNVGWVIFATGLILIGFGGLKARLGLVYIGLFLFIIGTITFSVTWKKSKKLIKLDKLLRDPSVVRGIGEKTVQKISKYLYE